MAELRHVALRAAQAAPEEGRHAQRGQAQEVSIFGLARHQAAGLGHKFLTHITRTRLLVHLVEGVPTEGAPDPAEAYRVIRGELAAFSDDLAAKPEIVVLSKTDLMPEESVLKSLADESDKEVCPISAVTGSGVKDLLSEIARRLFSEEE